MSEPSALVATSLYCPRMDQPPLLFCTPAPIPTGQQPRIPCACAPGPTHFFYVFGSDLFGPVLTPSSMAPRSSRGNHRTHNFDDKFPQGNPWTRTFVRLLFCGPASYPFLFPPPPVTFFNSRAHGPPPIWWMKPFLGDLLFDGKDPGGALCPGSHPKGTCFCPEFPIDSRNKAAAGVRCARCWGFP